MEQENLPQVQPAATPHESGVGNIVPSTEQSGASLEHTPASNREVPGAAAQSINQVVVPRPAVPQPVAAVTDDANTASNGDDDNPADANDIDVIEKEWVERAKQLVAQTRTDPHEQEKKVSALQADYLKKRYGKEMRLASE